MTLPTPDSGTLHVFSIGFGTGGTGLAGTGPVASSGITVKCATDAGDVNANANPIQLGTCNGSASQTWAVQASGALQLAGTTSCVDTVGERTDESTKLQLQDCNGAPTQAWQPRAGALVNAASGLCLDDPDSSTTDGTQLQIYHCNQSGAQLWSES